MQASDFLDRSRRDRIVQLVLIDKATNELVGEADAFVINSKNNIAILLSDCGVAEKTNLEAGDFVEFSDDPNVSPPRILSADSIRPDAYLNGLTPGHPFL